MVAQKKRGKVVVVGSLNMDVVMMVPRLPKSGETVVGGRFFTSSGGKGVNQAIAANRADGEVSFPPRKELVSRPAGYEAYNIAL